MLHLKNKQIVVYLLFIFDKKSDNHEKNSISKH